MTRLNMLDYNLPCIPVNFLKNNTSYWHSSDSEKSYINNCKKFGNTWRYWNSADQIKYKTNFYGYRSIEFTDIKNDDFFIVLGCSHSFGVGLPLEDTYSNLIACKIGIKYLNCSQGGGAANLIWTNSCLLIKNLKYKPRFVICQWPEIMRVNIFKDQSFFVCNPPALEEKFQDESIPNLYKAMLKEESFFYNSTRSYFDSVNIMWSMFGVEVINISFDPIMTKLANISYYDHYKYPRARDNHHPGREFNQKICKDILSFI